MDRRTFLKAMGVAFTTASASELLSAGSGSAAARKRPNVVFVFADQWRAQATGYAGDPNAVTPNLDRLAAASVNLTTAVSCCPVCTPYRASLLTGQYPLTHGLFLNDLCLSDDAVSIAEVFTAAGYDTGYIGKWHIDGHGRASFIPRQRRQGFDYWKVLECTHTYNRSAYYADADGEKKLHWDGYDAIAQTRDAQRYIASHARGGKPFLLVLSWGPPHNPFETAPQEYHKLFADADRIKLRPNVPAKAQTSARKDLQGYYAHCAALDVCVGDLRKTIAESGIEDDTIFIFTSDHGDMLGSQGQRRKQRPWDESILVPLLLRYPAACGRGGKTIDMPFNTPDIMPTLLGLAGIARPKTVEGSDFSDVLTGASKPDNDAALICCIAPCGEWTRPLGGREYRGLRTRRYTYVRDLKGPWLLYDNQADPYQQTNLVNQPDQADLQKTLDERLNQMLAARKDKFLPGADYIKQWGYKTDKEGTVPYKD
jgi:arylsulfatase A-like enzyme